MKFFSIRVLLFVNHARYKISGTNHVHNISKKKDDKTDHMVLLGQKSLVILHGTGIETVDKKNKPFLAPNLYYFLNKAPPSSRGELSNFIPDAAP